MSLRFRNTVARFIIAAYVLAGALLEVGHHDVHNIVLEATSAVSSHNCGANEIHISLDKRHECLACSQLTQRVATAAPYLSTNITAIYCLGHVLDTNERTPHTDLFHSGKRGPPVS